MNNWRHHGESLPGVRLDPFATGATFDGWHDNTTFVSTSGSPHGWLMTWIARTWLLREGWRRHGLLSPWDTPG